MAGNDPLIIRGKNEMREYSRFARAEGKTIDFVPTIGFFHDGHFSLIHESKKHADLTVVSIYVNPGQFSPNEDLSTYPSDFDGDIQKLKSVSGAVDVVFHPQNLGNVVSCVEINGGMGHETWVRVERLEKGLCGNSRHVFFRGVTTIVAKLFNIVEHDVDVFGKKNYQQWRIIKRMVQDLDFGINVIGADLIRDEDSLAKNSSDCIFYAISKSQSNAEFAAENGQLNCKELRDSVIQAIHEAGGKVDYAEESLGPLKEISIPVVFYVAAIFGNVRLLDNMEINV
ncbi:hypothetical protein ABFS83_09G024800 [Erythranthe nasuta]